MYSRPHGDSSRYLKKNQTAADDPMEEGIATINVNFKKFETTCA